MSKTKVNWKKYFLEFFSIFIAVISAFALNNWNENRRDSHSEAKILTEIKNGLTLDLKDIGGNKGGHELGIRACEVFRDLIEDQPVAQDSMALFYTVLVRDFTSIMNKSGYESLKSKGLEVIKNDALRFQIISMYDYHYQIIQKMEETVPEMQSFQSFYPTINSVLAPFMIFNDQGRFVGVEQPMGLSDEQKKQVLSSLWRIENNRKYKIIKYGTIEGQIRKLIQIIEGEL